MGHPGAQEVRVLLAELSAGQVLHLADVHLDEVGIDDDIAARRERDSIGGIATAGERAAVDRGRWTQD